MSQVDVFTEAYLLVLTLTSFEAITVGELIEKEHKTQGASIFKNELSCYQCDTMVEGDKCSNLALGNKTALIKKCHDDKIYCMVKKYAYTTSTENSTSSLKTWSLERNCTSKCEPGCIIIGERTKLYACTSCCSTTACNYGKGTASHSVTSHMLVILTVIHYICIPFR